MKDEINFHTLSKEVAKVEGGAKQVNIAQIKEVLSNLLYILANEYSEKAVLKKLDKYREGK